MLTPKEKVIYYILRGYTFIKLNEFDRTVWFTPSGLYAFTLNRAYDRIW